MKISFSGCGFLGVYHIGVAKCLVANAPEFVDSLDGFYGTSAGSLVAVMLCCRVGQDGGPRFAKKMSNLINASWLGPFGNTFDPSALIIRDLGRYLPPDAHKRVSGKVKISLTDFGNWSNWSVSEFNTRRELLNALVASCFIPLWSGWTLPQFRGKRVCDGGFTNNIPGSRNPQVITVCPFSGEADICPLGECQPAHMVFSTNTSFKWTAQNMFRLKQCLFPPKWEKLEELMESGYHDAMRFLVSRGLVKTEVERLLQSCEQSGRGNYIDYQVLYELPLVMMTTFGDVNLPPVSPPRVVRGVQDRSVYSKLLGLPANTLYSLWLKCVELMSTVSPWKLPLLSHLMRLLYFLIQQARWRADHKLLLLHRGSRDLVVLPVASLQ